MCDLKRDKKYSWAMYTTLCGVITAGVADYRIWDGLFHLDTFASSLYMVAERILQLVTLPILAAVAMWLLVRQNRRVDSEPEIGYN